MKKTILFTLLFAVGIAVQAQRTIDWSVEEIFEPTELVSNESSNTTPFPVHFSVKNNGTDVVKVGDTILYQADIYAGATRIVQGNLFFRVVNRELAVGDTLHIRINLSINARLAESANVSASITSFMVNIGSSDPIALEGQATGNNNTLRKDIVWYNFQKWGVSNKPLEFKNNILMYPVPANDVLNLELLMVEGNEVTVEIYDLQGKLVINETTLLNNGNAVSINTSSLEAGLYTIKVKNGTKISTSKFSVTE